MDGAAMATRIPRAGKRVTLEVDGRRVRLTQPRQAGWPDLGRPHLPAAQAGRLGLAS